MSRTAATTRSRHIFVTLIKQADGRRLPVMSSTHCSDESVCVNRNEIIGAFTLLRQLYMHDSLKLKGKQGAQFLNPDVFFEIASWTIGVSIRDLPLIAAYPRANILSHSSSIFSKLSMDPYVVIDAAIRGQEDILMNILRADPSYLLRKAIVKNSVGVEFELTPLEAAIMSTDVQMVEKMREHFEHLTIDLDGHSIDGPAEMHQQIKTIYIQSLNRYRDNQLAILKEQETKLLQLLRLPTDLTAAQTKQYKEIEEKIKQATKRIIAYSDALKPECNDIQKIIEAHNQAQEDNAFDFQPYVNAILSASPAELDVVMELINATTPEETAAVVARSGVAEKQSDAARLKSFDELTLVEKLNRFREELVKHMQNEIIFNPNHILAGLKSNDTARDTLTIATDPGYKKRSIIFSQLAGWAQRNANEPVRQDMRQGTWYLTEKNRHRARQSRFNEYLNGNIVRNFVVDVALVNSLLVDKFGTVCMAGRDSEAAGQCHLRRAAVRFQNLCRAKTACFQNLLRSQSSDLTNRGA